MASYRCTDVGGICGTFPSPEARRDEGLNLLGPMVLGYIRRRSQRHSSGGRGWWWLLVGCWLFSSRKGAGSLISCVILCCHVYLIYWYLDIVAGWCLYRNIGISWVMSRLLGSRRFYKQEETCVTVFLVNTQGCRKFLFAIIMVMPWGQTAHVLG